MRQLLFVLIIVLCTSSATSHVEEELIPWAAGLKLEWTHFQGKPKADSPHDALTNCGLSMNMGMQGKDLSFEVKALFNPKKSWVKKDGATTELRAHEQLHFDIYERYARELRKRLAEHAYVGGVKEIPEQSTAIYNEVNALLRATQKSYDAETDHSVIRDKQLEWERRIAEELAEMEAFESSTISLTLSD